MSGSTKLDPLEWAPFQTARSAVHGAFIWGTKLLHTLLCVLVCVSICQRLYMCPSRLLQSVPGECLKHDSITAIVQPWEMSVSVTVQRKENVIYINRHLLLKVISPLPYLLFTSVLWKTTWFTYMSNIIHDSRRRLGKEKWRSEQKTKRAHIFTKASQVFKNIWTQSIRAFCKDEFC